VGGWKPSDEFVFPERLSGTTDGLATIASHSRNLTQTDDDHWPDELTVSARRTCGRLAREVRYCCAASDLISY
jgi:hypothetical protein